MHEEDLKVLNRLLERYINRTKVSSEWGVYFIKERVTTIRNMRIEVFANDHNPPHFHVKSKDGKIDVVLKISDCSLIREELSSSDYKRIKAFYESSGAKEKLTKIWNKSKFDSRRIGP